MIAETLAEIEKDFQETSSDHDSFLIKKIAELKKKKLSTFNIEDIRLCISQDNIWKEESFKILVLLAINELGKDLLAEGDYYEGDLLVSLFKVKKRFWIQNDMLHKQITTLFEESMHQLHSPDISDSIRDELLKSFEVFRAL